jgi:hypothetical protein
MHVPSLSQLTRAAYPKVLLMQMQACQTLNVHHMMTLLLNPDSATSFAQEDFTNGT